MTTEIKKYQPSVHVCDECDLPPRHDSVLCDLCMQAHEKVNEIERTPGMEQRHDAMKAYVRGAMVQEKQLYRVRGMLDVHYRRAVYFNEQTAEMNKEQLW